MIQEVPPSSSLRAALRVLAFTAISWTAHGAPVPSAAITEFVADNNKGLVDGDGDASDWIEVWNASGEAGDLDGYFLTDDPLDLTKWRIPAVAFNSEGYVLVFASGKDRSDPAGEMHANFRLDAEPGAYLALVHPDGQTLASEFAGYPEQYEDVSYGAGFGEPVPVEFVGTGATAAWRVPSGAVAGWTAVGFDDTGWDRGATGIGFDAADYLPYIGIGGNVEAAMRNIHPSIYIRIPFEVADPSGISGLTLRMKWEDGFVAYLNGTEIRRENAPASPQWNSTANSNRSPESAVVVFSDYPVGGTFQVGTNVLAIHGLNASSGSSDMLIVPELVALRQDLAHPLNGYFIGPTPGSPNGTRLDGLVRDTAFDVDRGFYEAPFDLTISTPTVGAEIRYTLDGTPPSETTGQIYTGPIPIAGTTVVRAMAHRPGFEPTGIDTQTYVFPADVVSQPKMRPAITQSPVYGPQMIASLKAVPTISLVTDNPAFQNEFGANIRDEHQTSIEMIFPDGSPGFQEDGGLSNYGGRYTNFRKKSFRVAFRAEFGATKLKFPIFAGFEYRHFPPAREFDVIDLRSGSHDMLERGAYMSNRFTDDSMLDMGNIAPHGRFVHVYLNGAYWGQYHLRERWSADMASSYFGGSEDDYDAVNANDGFAADESVYDGTPQFWNETKSLVAGPDPFTNAAGHVDIANAVDFMLLWLSGDAESEFRAFGSAGRGVPFKFKIKDADGFLRSPTQAVSHPGPLGIMAEMRSGGNPDYAILLADRIHKHFFNDGALTPAKNIERLQKRVAEARPGFTSEAARWGNLYREPQSWESYQANLINNHFPNLTAGMIAKFKAAGMYPGILAPVFSQHGGTVAPGAGITMATSATAVYYTLDGSDPRLPGGSVNPAATLAPFAGGIPTPRDFLVSGHVWKYLDDGSNQGVAWRAPGFQDSGWAAGPSELGYNEGDEATVVGFVGGAERNATTYFRTTVELTDPAAYSYFVLKLKYDDGAAVYANGVEILRTANLPANAAFDAYATGATPNEGVFFDFQIPSSRFVEGTNTLAVEIHNQSANSSDISFDLVLRGEVDTSNGGNVTEPVPIDRHGSLRARAYNVSTGQWSALTEAFFTIGSVPADGSNLVLSELHYHPGEPSTPSEIAESTDRDDYEFVEFHNPGNAPIDLGGVSFSSGISFSFPLNYLLEPGSRVVIVRDRTAFTARYGEDPNVVVAGEYSGRLSNEGERVALGSAAAGEFLGFTYDDQLPWPTLADGGGHSLVRTGAEPGDGASWAPHATPGGAPGYPDAIVTGGYLAWKNAHSLGGDSGDADDDGLRNLVEYGLGTNPRLFEPSAMPRAALTVVGDDAYPTITFRKRLGATDVRLEVERAADLAAWAIDDTMVLVSETEDPGGETATVVLRAALPVTPGTDTYLRVVVTLVP